MYDSRLGRWKSTDALEYKYPSLSSYHFSNNNPIYLTDSDGNKLYVYLVIHKRDGTVVKLKILETDDVSYLVRGNINEKRNPLKGFDKTLYINFYEQKDGTLDEGHLSTKYVERKFAQGAQEFLGALDKIAAKSDGVIWTSPKAMDRGKANGRRTYAEQEDIDLLMSVVGIASANLKMGSGGLNIPDELLKSDDFLNALEMTAKSLDVQMEILNQATTIKKEQAVAFNDAKDAVNELFGTDDSLDTKVYNGITGKIAYYTRNAMDSTGSAANQGSRVISKKEYNDPNGAPNWGE